MLSRFLRNSDLKLKPLPISSEQLYKICSVQFYPALTKIPNYLFFEGMGARRLKIHYLNRRIENRGMIYYYVVLTIFTTLILFYLWLLRILSTKHGQGNISITDTVVAK